MKDVMTFDLDKVIGHRGACGYAPENTLISMSKAHELGAKWVEFDVMLAGTGEPIIIHDFTLDRTTNGQGEVGKTDLHTLTSLDCGSWFSKEYEGIRIPSLSELLHHVSGLNMGINIELKPFPGMELLTALKTVDLLKNQWPAECKIPLLSSFSATVLKFIYESGVACKLGYIIDSWSEEWHIVVDQYRCVSLHVDHKLLTEDRITQIKNTGRFVLAYTVNDPDRAKQLFQWGVDSVFSDYPDLILSALK